MRIPLAVFPFLLLLDWAPCAQAADLAQIDRSIRKEPAYRSNAPRYCLLVFGLEAQTHVWLVVDGDVLYVDRNGNGDLTDQGKQVPLPKLKPSGLHQYAEERSVRVGDIRHDRLTHSGLQLTQRRVRPDLVPKSVDDDALKTAAGPGSDGFVYELTVAVEVRPQPEDGVPISGRIRQEVGDDAGGYLQFAARPLDAPVIHFGGRLHMALLCRQVLTRGEKPAELMTMIGTPGVGKGTFASVDYAGLFSDDVHPVAVVEFPARRKGGPPPMSKVILDHRC
jgi:hypothetical protein